MTKKSALWTSVFLLAAAIGTAGAEPVTKAVPVAQCYGANKQILLYELPARTHLQDSLGWGDGAAIEMNQAGGREAAYFDYQDYKQGDKFVYLLYGFTTQHSCSFDCKPTVQELQEWTEDLVYFVTHGGERPTFPCVEEMA
jgi:hypothetical protein